ncbi:microfibril-associated glycoprotein 4-like [Ylistrum balloti]|uniref:microfibril-associated glycoprotein 4-like n=1 Tax=Ylistrum balloti TaxID=509963 RepID=UPI002905D982|nr:microfibril-associated glycoprotein 4-like [Ylistrum balloti]
MPFKMNAFHFALITILHTVNIKACRNLYQRNETLAGILFSQNIIQEYNSVTRLQVCAEYCKIQHCLSFTVHTHSGLCRLYSTIFDCASDGVSYEGAIYYHQWSDSCLGWKKMCSPHSTGVFDLIQPRYHHKITVLCDMDTHGGGWTVFQNRFDGSLSFNRTFGQYKETFRNFSGEFWLGLEVSKYLCNYRPCEVRIELEDWEGVGKFALYSNFKIGWQALQYTLTIDGYSGTAGDAMGNLNGLKFSTFDREEEMNNTINCPELRPAGWWYNDCGQSNLNGKYSIDNGVEDCNAMTWHTFHGSYRPLKKSRMMLRELG